MINQLKRHLSLLSAIALLAGIIIVSFPRDAHAVTQQIVERSITLKAGATDGGSKAGGNVKHQFDFKVQDIVSTIGSITFQYCTTAAPVASGVDCIAPTGMSTAGVTLTNSTGVTGFTSATPSAVCDTLPTCLINNTVTISRATATAIGGSTTPFAVSYELSGIVNPSAINTTFFVRIKVWSGTGATGTVNDAGTVAASTAEPIILNGTMPESLIFCTGRDIPEVNNVPDCPTASSGNINFNQLFSPLSPSYATSQMAASTNAGFGYSITVNGPTMTSGSNTITAISAAGGDITRPGTSQFGMTLATDIQANNPLFGAAAPVPASGPITTPTGGSNYHARAFGDYVGPDDTVNDTTYSTKYKFVSGDVVADSNSLASDPQVFTVTYLVDVTGSQPAGDYKSTLTYICTAKF